MNNYKLLISTSCESGLTANIYQNVHNRELVNIRMCSINGAYRTEENITLKAALDILSDQLQADLEWEME